MRTHEWNWCVGLHWRQWQLFTMKVNRDRSSVLSTRRHSSEHRRKRTPPCLGCNKNQWNPPVGHNRSFGTIAFCRVLPRWFPHSNGRDLMQKVRMWNANTGDEVATLRGHKTQVDPSRFPVKEHD